MSYESFLTLGDAAYQSGQGQEALLAWRQAFAFSDEPTEKALIIGRFLSLGFLREARDALDGLGQNGDDPAILALKSSLALEKGDVKEAISILDSALARANLKLLSNKILALHYEAHINQKAICDASQDWAQLAFRDTKSVEARNHEAPLRSAQFRSEDRLRLGFLAGDLCAHPVGFLIFPILEELQQRAETVETFIYNNTPHLDWMTQKLHSYVDLANWKNVYSLSDADVIKTIKKDELSILIDCSGHTARNRLSVFVERIAPPQISWGGYFSTTGLSTVDGVIMDRFHLSSGQDIFFTERLLRFPSRFVYRPPPFAPPITDAPFFRNGFITFGSFNNVTKINETVIETWSSVLRSVPGSRLILKWRSFADQDYCNLTLGRFLAHGVEPGRVALRPFSPYRDTLAEYRDVDIALDPFPFTGGQTSLDALWMGLPLITMAGEAPVARQGHALVNQIGRPEWSVTSLESYIEAAQQLVSDPLSLRNIRFTQRDAIRSSNLWNARLFVDELLTIAGERS